MILCQLTLWRWQLIPLPTCSIEARQTAKHIQVCVLFCFLVCAVLFSFCVVFCAAAQQRLLTCMLKVTLGVALPVAGRPAVLPRTCCCRCCWALSCWACCSCWAGSRPAAPLPSPAACSHQCSANQDRINTAPLKLKCHLRYSLSQDQSVPPLSLPLPFTPPPSLPPSLPPYPSKFQMVSRCESGLHLYYT